jgi:AcrR family transcriptional regulator
MRADARRNRERILAVVADAFAAKGLEVPLDDLAKRAGVGPGTLYRHFPTKASLYEAVVDHRLRQICTEAEALADAPDAGSALREFLGRLADEIMPKQDLVDALARVDIDVGATLAATGADLRAAIDVLLRRAQAAGAVRRDVTLDDLMGLLGGLLIAARGRRAADPKRMLGVVWDGLTVPGSS